MVVGAELAIREIAVVIQIADEHPLVERELAAKEEGVLALGHADHVAERIEVRRGDRTGQRILGVEISGYVQIRQRRRPLDGVVGAERARVGCEAG